MDCVTFNRPFTRNHRGEREALEVKYVIGVADAKISGEPEDVLTTHALGSCLGLMAYDPISKVGGMLHVMMPLSTINPQRAKENPYTFVDTGVPCFFNKLYSCGALKKRLVVKVTGGASLGVKVQDRFNVGKRNYIILKKMFWKSGILINAQDIGGSVPRTVSLEIATGQVWVSIAGQEHPL